jgi:hypothetical protein
MNDRPTTARVQALMDATRPFLQFFNESTYARKAGTPGVNDFAVGHPHEFPLPAVVDAPVRCRARRPCAGSRTTSEPGSRRSSLPAARVAWHPVRTCRHCHRRVRRVAVALRSSLSAA